MRENDFGEPCTCTQDDCAPHTCPYREDVCDDHETLCTCCDSCVSQCVQEI